ncbi:unnamed protein product [Sphagnum jensenii]|uniref:Uncharacterized protein n=1 Tax=Sphagnum jensenii TaxID=128206 RepID=A0ABP1A7V3_9BRYO
MTMGSSMCSSSRCNCQYHNSCNFAHVFSIGKLLDTKEEESLCVRVNVLCWRMTLPLFHRQRMSLSNLIQDPFISSTSST